VIDWSVVEPIAIDFNIAITHHKTPAKNRLNAPTKRPLRHESKFEIERESQRLADVENRSISSIAAELQISVTTVRRVCRTLELGSYAPGTVGIKRTSSQCPFGWTEQRGRLVKSPTEWAWVKKMRSLRASGLSLHKIAARLTAERVQTKNDGRWFAKTVSQILKFNEPHLTN
jgi:hypothetical protein